MQVLLRADVEDLGKSGDIVTVADGHARNFLIPRGLAMKPTEGNIRQVEREKQQQERMRDAELEEVRKLAERISTVSCTVPVKVGEEGQMYGSVTAKEIADAMKDEDVDLDPKDIILEDPINELGVYSFTIRLAPGIEATSKVWVVEG